MSPENLDDRSDVEETSDHDMNLQKSPVRRVVANSTILGALFGICAGVILILADYGKGAEPIFFGICGAIGGLVVGIMLDMID